MTNPKFIGILQKLLLGRVAQLGEHRPYKPRVTGSSPVPPITHPSIKNPIIWGRSSVWLERRPVTPEVASSSLVVPATPIKGLQRFLFLSKILHSKSNNKLVYSLFGRIYPKASNMSKSKSTLFIN